jgi:NAD(P)H-hydrate epimerase
MKLVTVAEMQKVERQADQAGLTYAQMMENAGSNLAQAVRDACEKIETKSVLGLVGSGNNGGDTLVALAALALKGWKAAAYLIRPRTEGDALVERLARAGGSIFPLETPSFKGFYPKLETILGEYSVILDGVLGTGARLPLKPELAVVLQAVRRAIHSLDAPPFVIAIDCPSGVDCDSGAAAPECIPANLTVTMAAMKAGLLSFPAYELAGEIKMVGIGLQEGEPALPAWKELRRSVVDEEFVRAALPERPMDAHKGTFGTAVAVVGSVNYTGAALLAGKAAYRVGAGLVTLAVPGPLHAALAGQFPEATWILLPDDLGVIAENAAPVLRKNLGRATAVLMGCGFGTEETTRLFLQRFFNNEIQGTQRQFGFMTQRQFQETNPAGHNLTALVVDADGLKLLARIPGWAKLLPPGTVLTPHPGEMAILTGLSKEEIQANRTAVAERFAKQWGQVVVLKGAFTVVAEPGGQTAVVPVATSALARAGTGDVLAGIILGLRAQGVDGFEAAAAGAWLHAQTGLHAAAAYGTTASVLAGDLVEFLPEVIAELT